MFESKRLKREVESTRWSIHVQSELIEYLRDHVSKVERKLKALEKHFDISFVERQINEEPPKYVPSKYCSEEEGNEKE